MSHGELKSLSPTAIKVWESCPARAVASTLNRPPQGKAMAADLGSAVHQALEFFIRATKLDKTHAYEEKLLLQLYVEAYKAYFGDDASLYQDGVDMLKRWFKDTEWDEARTVLTCEVKKSIQINVPTRKTSVTFNYILDRMDRIDNPDGTFDIEVVDYKSWMKNLGAEALGREIQVRLYAMVAMIEYPNARRIWVTLDQLRYGAVGTVFDRNKCVEAYRFVQRIADEIMGILESDEPVPEKINDECRYCIRKLDCVTLRKHKASGGILALDDVDRAALELVDIQDAIKGLQALEEELTTFLQQEANERNIPGWVTDDGVEIEMTVYKQRGIDPQRAAQVIGADLFAQYGKLTIGVIDKLLKGDEITPQQKNQLKSLIKPTYGAPKVKVKRANPIGSNE